MPFQSLLLFCFCFTAFVSQLFLMHDFCYKNVFARPPFCLLSFTAGRSLLFLQAKASSAGSSLPSLQDKPLSLTFSVSEGKADTSQTNPPPCTHCIGRAEMSFQSLLLFCLCSTASVSQLFLMHDFCGKNVSARPPFVCSRSLQAEVFFSYGLKPPLQAQIFLLCRTSLCL